jgi:type VI secretion system secreted protein VgrG
MYLPQIQLGVQLLGDALISSVEVVQELNHHWRCSIVCRQTADQRIAVEDILGKPLDVTSTDGTGATHSHFSGFIYDVQLEYEVWGSYAATLNAISSSYLMDLTALKQYYSEQTLSSIASTMAGRSGLSVDVNAPGGKALNYVQYGETDFSFLNRIVDDYRAWMRPKKDGLEIFAGFQSGASITWREGNGLISFRLQGTMASPSFNGSHYDHHAMISNSFEKVSKPPQFYDGAQRLTGAVQSASQQLPPGFEPQRARAFTLDDYQTQLQDESERSIGAAVTATGQSRNQELKAGNALAVQGVSGAEGTFGLIKVVHQWTPGGYSNTFVGTPWMNYRNSAPPPARVWSGIVPARVVDHNDPKKMGRIKIQFFWQLDGSTHWARATSPHAGPGRGFMFMPEVGDEVAVAFEDGDPERPVIIGSLWNGVQTADRSGYYGGDISNNDVKNIMTKSGNRIQIADLEGSEAITIATPNHASFTISENHSSTGRPLINLNSSGDIFLNAPDGRIHLRAKLFSREIG